VYVDAFAEYAPLLKHPICYNGDILETADIVKIIALTPQVERFMIGRGILQNPFLLSEIRKQKLSRDEKVSMLRGFHLSLIELSKQKYSGDVNLMRRFVEMWTYHAEGFEDGRKILKQVKKCNTLVKYEAVLFKAINDLI